MIAFEYIDTSKVDNLSKYKQWVKGIILEENKKEGDIVSSFTFLKGATLPAI